MSEHDATEEELRLGARVCQRCRKPFVLIAKTDEERLALHTRVMEAVVDEWQMPGYLVVPVVGNVQQMPVVAVVPGQAPRRITQEEYAEAQEQAFLRHRCAAATDRGSPTA